MNVPAISWRLPPGEVKIETDEVHVWRACVELPASEVLNLERSLSAGEKRRADGFRFASDRSRFIVAHGALRGILGRYLGVKPHLIRFSYGPYGKPALVAEPGKATLRFCMAHSLQLALYAVARGREVGLDVEYMRGDIGEEGIAAQFFSAREVASLHGLPCYLRKEGFYNCWTRKEAYVKARGEGLSLGLDQFDVSLAPGEAAALLNSPAGSGNDSQWSLLALYPGPGYVGALAVEGYSWKLRCWQWSPDDTKLPGLQC